MIFYYMEPSRNQPPAARKSRMPPTISGLVFTRDTGEGCTSIPPRLACARGAKEQKLFPSASNHSLIWGKRKSPSISPSAGATSATWRIRTVRNANGWAGSFYPAGMKSRDCLSYYATQFANVEFDSTFYRKPTPEYDIGGTNSRVVAFGAQQAL